MRHRLTAGPNRPKAAQSQLTRGDYHPRVIVPVDASDGEIAEIAKGGKAAATKRAYRSDIRVFESWCAGPPGGPARAEPWPTSQETLVRYISARAKAGAAMRTVLRGMVAIRQANRARGFDPPTGLLLEQTWSGLVAQRGMRARQVAPLSTAQIKAMVDHLDRGRARGAEALRRERDRALLLVGFAGGMRRSEIVGIDREHLRWVKQTDAPGVVVFLPRSKTDQAGEGRHVAVSYVEGSAYCPARALERWLAVSGVQAGPVFVGTRGRRLTHKRLDGGDVARLVKRLVVAAGIAEEGAVYGGHSLRAGMITQARRNGAGEDVVMWQSGHRNIMQLREYNRANVLDRSVVPFLGL